MILRLVVCRRAGDAVGGQGSTGQHPGQEGQEEGPGETAGGSQVHTHTHTHTHTHSIYQYWVIMASSLKKGR